MSARFHLTRVRDDRHRFQAWHEDVQLADCMLETRSFLIHDLTHYAVEAEVPLHMGFWGHLGQGVSLEQLAANPYGEDQHPELALAESLTGPMQSVWHERMPLSRWVEHVAPLLPEHDVHALGEACLARLRGLVGAWRATPFGGTLVLSWPPGAPVVQGR